MYDDNKYEETLELCDRTSPYGLTGSIFARDRYAIDMAFNKLRYAAGNFYINDKPTGAVIAQQPLGGSRASGTNDKAGGPLNLIRWTNARCIKEALVPPTSYGYPFLGEKSKVERTLNFRRWSIAFVQSCNVSPPTNCLYKVGLTAHPNGK